MIGRTSIMVVEMKAYVENKDEAIGISFNGNTFVGTIEEEHSSSCENLVRVRECETPESNIFKRWPNTSILVYTVDC